MALCALATPACTAIDLDALEFGCTGDEECTIDRRCSPLTATCVRLGCGDAVIDTGEDCDDGNQVDGDGCSARCAVEPGAVCTGAPSRCASCGNRRVEVGETCDDGDRDAGDGCDSDCQVETGYTCGPTGCVGCGDGVRQPGESCDDGGSSGACRACRIPLGASCAGEVGERSLCTATRVRSVSAGARHTCIIDGVDLVRCVGSNREPEGFLYMGQATPPADLPRVAYISAGSTHTCAITLREGRVLCWGAPELSRPPPGLPPARAISAGTSQTCAILEDDTALCWGRAGTTTITTAIREISVGDTHTCALRLEDGRVDCVGDQDGRIRPPPVAFATLDTGRFHTCGVLLDGSLRCWSREEDMLERTRPPAGRDWVAVTASHYFNCALRRDGGLDCFGSRTNYGELSPPVGPFIAVSAGWEHACALRPDGPLECWGDPAAFTE